MDATHPLPAITDLGVADDLLPDPYQALLRYQPDFLGYAPKARNQDPPPVAAEDLHECVTTELYVLTEMTADQRSRLPNDTWLGAIRYYLEHPGEDPYWLLQADRYRRYTKVQCGLERERALPPLAALDPSTISVDLLSSQSEAQRWRFRDCLRQRELWLRVLPLCEPSATSVLRTARCGRPAIVKRHRGDGRYAVEAETCGKRTCPVCAIRHRLRTRDRLREALAGPWRRDDWRFVTLTLRSDHKGLRARIERLQRSFRRLRQQQVWRRTQDSGVAVIEIKWSKRSKDWHVHMHVLARGRYIPHAALSAAWEQATGDSPVCDIRAITSRDKAIAYLCKYIGKSPADEDPDLTPDLLAQWYVGIKRKRLLIGYGDLKRLPEVQDGAQDARLAREWEWIETLDLMIHFASAGDPAAQAIMSELNKARDQERANDRGSPGTDQPTLF